MCRDFDSYVLMHKTKIREKTHRKKFRLVKCQSNMYNTQKRYKQIKNSNKTANKNQN